MVLSHIVALLCHNEGFGVIGFVDVVNFRWWLYCCYNNICCPAVVIIAVTLGKIVVYAVIDVDNIT